MLSTLEKITMTSSAKEKESIIRVSDTPLLRKVFSAALNPFITYGLAENKTPHPANLNFDSSAPLALDSEEVWTLLRSLADRKLTGSAATATVEIMMSKLQPADAEVLRRIILRDLRCGIGSTLVNKVFKDLIPTFDVMLAKPLEDYEDSIKFPLYAEHKFDGMRAIGIVRPDGDVSFVSRNGKLIPAVDHLADDVKRLARGLSADETVYVDGELVAGSFNDTVSRVRSKSKSANDAVFQVFEALLTEEFMGRSPMIHEQRRRRLEGLDLFTQTIVLTSTKVVGSISEVRAFVEGIWTQGGEGAILKSPMGIYQPKRTTAWLKVKKCETIDVPIVDCFVGKGKYKNQLGGFVVDVNGVSVDVGSGLTDEERNLLWVERDSLKGRMVEVQFHEYTPDGSLRHPRFVRFRPDKDV